MFDDNSVFHDRGYKIQFKNIGSGKTLAKPTHCDCFYFGFLNLLSHGTSIKSRRLIISIALIRGRRLKRVITVFTSMTYGLLFCFMLGLTVY
jgi:hypothetical protein